MAVSCNIQERDLLWTSIKRSSDLGLLVNPRRALVLELDSKEREGFVTEAHSPEHKPGDRGCLARCNHARHLSNGIERERSA